MTYATTKPPAYSDLPTAKPRTMRGRSAMRELAVRLEVVTPILGGSHQSRAIDDIDIIRAPSVRGHLRFWWRALYAAQYECAEELHKRESELWGRAATDDGGRSAVEVRIDVDKPGESDHSDIRLYDSKSGKATLGSYALWPARKETKTNTPIAPRRQPGTQFQLTLRVDSTRETEVRNALRAWILFGGYGGRTRRGLGSLKTVDVPDTWTPSVATRGELTKLFGFDIFAVPNDTPGDVPRFGGAALHLRPPVRDAQTAWTAALDSLKEFRQGTSGARQRGPNGNKQRPSVSNWPEGDKVRHLTTPKGGLPWAHTPRHNDAPAWPRAGFGLPIVGQFQQQSRENRPGWRPGDKEPRSLYWDELSASHPNYGAEPPGFELRWRSPRNGRASDFEEHDRLASPLIVKALPLADGTFVPCALWLSRAYPSRGEVIMRNKSNSQAPFDLLVAEGDTALFPALANKASLRQAFLDWLHAKYQTTVIAP